MSEYIYKKFITTIDKLLKNNTSYFFYGENNYYMHKTVDMMVNTIKNVFKETVYSWEVNFDQLCGKLTTPTLFTEKVVVVLRNYEFATKKLKQQLQEFLKNYHYEHYFFILYESILDYRTKNEPDITYLKTNFVSVNFVNLTKTEIIETFIPENFNTKISEPAKELLYENTGNNLWLLLHELEKLGYYAKDKKEITDIDVANSCSLYDFCGVKELLENIERHNISGSVSILNTLIYNGVEPLYIFNYLLWYFRKDFQRRTPSIKMYRILKLLHETDYKFKTTGGNKYILETTIVNLCKILS